MTTAASTMRAWVLPELGGPDRYRLQEVARPEPGPGEVRVEVRASALNHIDLWLTRGLPEPPLPHVPGADVAGVIDALGPDVGPGADGAASPAVGDEVLVDPTVGCGECAACLADEQPLCRDLSIIGEHRWGGHADAVIVPAANVVPKPANLSWAEAAAVPVAVGNAVRMLRRARLAEGDTLLVVGFGGGVSSAGMLVGKALGARVFVTTRDPDKAARAIALGAEAAFDSSTEFHRELRAATGDRGADVVFENVGPATWERSMRSLARGGRVVTCGGTTGTEVALNLPVLFWRHLEVIGSTMNSRRDFAEAVALVADGRVPAVVDSVLALEDYPAALARIEAGAQVGKIVLSHGDT